MKKKVAIVSSYNVFCGIAYNAERIEYHLKKHYDVEVLPVDIDLVRKDAPSLIKEVGDQHIKDIAYNLNKFDYINIQLEAGIFGKKYSHIWPRVISLLKATSKPIILTMHCSYKGTDISMLNIIKHLLLKPIRAIEAIEAYCDNKYTMEFWDLLLQKDMKKQIACVVYNPVEKDKFHRLLRLKRVYDHPLTYFDKEERNKIKNSIDISNFKKKLNVKDEEFIIGVFGFLMPYKGFTDAILALPYLPENYKLVIFGGANITVIKSEGEVDPYLASLMNLIVTLNLESRVIFTGTLSDNEMAIAMSNSDIVILPYFDTGQVASGPTSMAIELAQHIICTDTMMFRVAYHNYYPEKLVFYGSGNYIELAKKVIDIDLSQDREVYYHEKNIESQTKLYMDIWEGKI